MNASLGEEQLLWLWGKTEKGKPEAYHPLLFHLMDVGIVAEMLWDVLLSAKTRAQIAAMLEVDEKIARSLFAVLSALHDIGKCAPNFQHQPFHGAGPIHLYERLNSIGLSRAASSQSEPHGLVSTRILHPSPPELSPLFARGANPHAAKIWSVLTGGHHGTLPTKKQLEFGDAVLGNKRWNEARCALIEKVVALFGDQLTLPLEVIEAKYPAFVPMISGLISIADWIASWQKHFPCVADATTKISICEYSQQSRGKAQEALQEIGWLTPPRFDTSETNFKELFGFTPNALQEEVVALSDKLDKPFLLIIETPMGSGKTEAALWACDVALQNEYSRGFYFAMPTQATSDAMFMRLHDKYFSRRHHLENIDLQLAHSNAELTKHNEFSTTSSEDGASGAPRDEVVRAAVGSWFSARKRPLLAPFGIGTLDQALMGVLQTRHWFVRQFALHDKIVVFDEVHAVDVYQGELLAQLLSWLRVLGCRVILLSATLPSQKREQLLRAWNPNVTLENAAAYPRLSLVRESDDHALCRHIALEETKTCHLAPHATAPDAIAATLRNKLQNGGCAIVFCNTVARAQDVFEELQKQLQGFIPNDDFHLLHARMPMIWRKTREKIIRDTFGRDRRRRPERAVIVSTQVLEASVDFSVDYMMSEMAPVDLLLQRMGREQRHATDSDGKEIFPLPHLVTPELAILADMSWNEAPPKRWGDYDDTVYPRALLLRSWLALRALPARGEVRVLAMPHEIERLIEKVYSEEVLNGDQDWQNALYEAENLKSIKDEKNAGEAKNVLVSKPRAPRDLINQQSLVLDEDDDPRTHQELRARTRNGLPSITVLCLHEVDGALYLPDKSGAPDLSRPISEKHSPDLDASSDLMNYAVSISRPALFKYFTAQNLPGAWQKNPHLRHTRLLKLKEGSAEVAGFALSLDFILGLHARKT